MSKVIVTDEKKLLSALGLCERARKLTAGVQLICEAMRRTDDAKPIAVFMASDVSANTAKRLTDKCGFYGVELIELQTVSDELSRALGKRSSVAAVALADRQMYSLTEKYFRFC